MLKQESYASLVQGQTITILECFTLESGKVLEKVPVAYKTWGTLNETRDNVMVICHALSGSADVQDWWGPLLGPGRAFDTNKFFIFCGNVLGSPYGTCSPMTCDPKTGKRYGPNFPLTTIRDDVLLHRKVLDSLGVEQIQYVIGGSMGGMQVLEWAFFGDYVRFIIPIATSGRHSAWCISWGEAQRQSIYSDPKYCDGHYTEPPANGLSAARMAALLTYRSRNSFESRFGRKSMPKQDVPPEVVHNEGHRIRLHGAKDSFSNQNDGFSVYSAQSYLRYQGDKFVQRFDANCYIAITRKLDTHDISRGRGPFDTVLKSIQQKALIIGIDTDGLFTPDDQLELGLIPNSKVVIISSGDGHDGFLLEFEQIQKLIMDFIQENTPFTSVAEPIYSKEPMNSVFGEAEDLLLW